MLNYIWFGLLAISLLAGAFHGNMAAVSTASFEAAKGAVTLALGLVGVMALWLGVMRVAQDGGLMQRLARLIRPLMVRLFPDVPSEHPAMAAMIMNITANMLGLGNAATPFGIKAMKELDTLNPRKGVATDAMALFLAINTSSVTILPLGVIGIRAAAGSKDPAIITVTTIFATICSTIVAITLAKLFSRLPAYSLEKFPGEPAVAAEPKNEAAPEVMELGEAPTAVKWRKWLVLALILTFLGAMGYQIHLMAATMTPFAILSALASGWLIPAILVGLIAYGFVYGVKVYDSLVKGAKEGFEIAIKIIPFLVAIMVAVAMFRASGALADLQAFLAPVLDPLGLPAEALAMAIVRPLSGSGAMGIMTETINTMGPDTYVGQLVSTLNGCTETTLYVMAVYFGAVGITKVRHSLWAALLADLTGVIASVFICRIFFL